jgi:hypothetical protein
MKARIAIVIAIGTLGLVGANEALALPNPPVQLAPTNGQPFTAGSDTITFQAQINPLPLTPPAFMDFYVSRGTPTFDSTGVMTNWIDHLHGGPTSGDPSIYAATTTTDMNWPDVPGTYQWQAVYYDCTQDPDCFNESATTFSFIIVPRSPSSVSPSNPPNTHFTAHPPHKTHKRKLTFSFKSDVAGATFQCLYAQGWSKCTSPHTFRHLKPGRFRFQVKAIVNGVEDPTPASWFFKVLP